MLTQAKNRTLQLTLPHGLELKVLQPDTIKYHDIIIMIYCNNEFNRFRFRHSMMTWGEKFSSAEIDDAFGEFKIDGGMIDGEHLKSIMVAKKDES